MRWGDAYHLGQLLGAEFLVQARLLQTRADDVRAQADDLANVEPHARRNQLFGSGFVKECLNGARVNSEPMLPVR